MKRSRENWYSKSARIINSALAFSIAYMTVTSVFFIVTALTGKMFGFETTVYYYGVKFMHQEDIWGRLSISLIYTSGIFATLATGIISAFAFYKFKQNRFVLNLIFIWGMIISGSVIGAQGLIIILGAGEYNSPFYQNLAVVVAWLHIPSMLYYIIASLFFLFGAFVTLYYSRPFLSLAYSFHKVNKTSRKIKFYSETVLLPFLPGSLIVLFVTFPYNMWVTIVYLAFIAASILLAMVSMRLQMIKTDEMLRYENLQKVNFLLIVLFIMFFSFIYITFRGFYLG